ncbi:hypothetical protein HALLA_07895 [Halostagnicola larsenii XH-48]|uniref:Uncharacterized protein n=2 Tax=Halostagnicola larsenii TaxID=353800 RepID=W0JNS1_9EURY|nr:hypothetical protein [Halostagnicola larsenii]AHF98794.1 hypothetical protein HALLA_07895 [Halostagnicola larsenii XH-48]
MDHFDWIAVVGFVLLTASSLAIDGIVVAAAFGGFLLSLASWRLYDGRPWEALGWLFLVGSALTLVTEPGGAVFVAGFFGSMAAGVGLLFASRLEWLPDVWTLEESVSN